MYDKYLPIGTVCTVRNSNKKLMVISYFSLEYNGNVKMYDYKGCVYPEGLLLPSQTVSFNHEDIENIEYMGYQNDQYQVFNNTLTREEVGEAVSYEQKPIMTNFKFDENGVVIFDGSISNEPEVLENITSPILNSNPFMAKTNYITEEEPLPPKVDIFKFDENGIVISDESVVSSDISTSTTSRYQFDENGFVIADGNIREDRSNISDFKFDEDGTVISDNVLSIEEKKPVHIPAYQFDENGVVISE